MIGAGAAEGVGAGASTTGATGVGAGSDCAVEHAAILVMAAIVVRDVKMILMTMEYGQKQWLRLVPI